MKTVYFDGNVPEYFPALGQDLQPGENELSDERADEARKILTLRDRAAKLAAKADARKGKE
jgi:hypothetical protein